MFNYLVDESIKGNTREWRNDINFSKTPWSIPTEYRHYLFICKLKRGSSSSYLIFLMLRQRNCKKGWNGTPMKSYIIWSTDKNLEEKQSKIWKSYKGQKQILALLITMSIILTKIQLIFPNKVLLTCFWMIGIIFWLHLIKKN